MEDNKNHLLEIVLKLLVFRKNWPISAEQFAILEIANGKRLRICEIQKHLSIPTPSMSILIKDLWKKKYIDKVAPLKGHGYVILVTDEGLKLINEIRSSFTQTLKS